MSILIDLFGYVNCSNLSPVSCHKTSSKGGANLHFIAASGIHASTNVAHVNPALMDTEIQTIEIHRGIIFNLSPWDCPIYQCWLNHYRESLRSNSRNSNLNCGLVLNQTWLPYFEWAPDIPQFLIPSYQSLSLSNRRSLSISAYVLYAFSSFSWRRSTDQNTLHCCYQFLCYAKLKRALIYPTES